MAKRKNQVDSQDSASDGDSSDTPPPKTKKMRKESGSKGSSTKTAKKGESSTKDAEGPVVQKSAAKEEYVDLGKRRRVTARMFKGSPLIDIREYYETDGEMKPGKKGISLSHDQWKELKNGVDSIDAMLAKLQEK